MLRRQLPVSSPVELRGLIRATSVALTGSASARDTVAATLAARHDARHLVLTDSGTSALVLALRATAGPGGTVALPGYSCIDLTAASRFAGVRVRLYDVDPATLGVDLDSLARALARGVDAVVVAHLYGFPVDMPAVTSLAATHGVPVIEDAAQGAGGTLGGRVLGGFGDLSILSFGRGKGTTGGHGGAVMAHTLGAARRLEALGIAGLGVPAAGWRDVAAAAAQWAFGRPALYGLPSSVPSLRLGEMVYRAAHEPAPLSMAAASLVRSAFALAQRELAVRRSNARVLHSGMTSGDVVRFVRPISGAEPGYLRFPVLCQSMRDAPATHLGIFPGYPRTLFEQDELRPCLPSSEGEQLGARELRRSLVTLPTHGQLTGIDLDRLVMQLRVAGAMPAVTPVLTTEPIAHALDC